jgi:hypothetical protein
MKEYKIEGEVQVFSQKGGWIYVSGRGFNLGYLIAANG